ncbi:MAG: hypothetical protein HY396_02240 [Candidatus Doudnabacteria bacterium]|nr:hypothetical protein [Candidatus Doudnabacteria bacterium]
MVELLEAKASAEEKVGIFSVVWQKAASLPLSIRQALHLRGDESYLGLHVDDKVVGERPLDFLRSFRSGFRKVASFMAGRKLEPAYVIGITYEKLAHAASFYGFGFFEVDPAELDARELARIEQGYMKTQNYLKGEPMGSVLVCFAPFDRFMDRHLKLATSH